MEKSEVRASLEASNSSLLSDVQTGCATNPVGGALWAEVKRSGHEFDHLPPCSAEVKNEWSNAAAPPICLYGMGKEKFAFFLWFSFS